jgi:hypothetical protein
MVEGRRREVEVDVTDDKKQQCVTIITTIDE